MKRYAGKSEPGAGGPGEVRVYGDTKHGRALRPRNDLANHSPDGFQWGYGGSGPAQLALALLADATGDDEFALRHHQAFKFAVVAGLPAAWVLDEDQIRRWAEGEVMA